MKRMIFVVFVASIFVASLALGATPDIPVIPPAYPDYCAIKYPPATRNPYIYPGALIVSGSTVPFVASNKYYTAGNLAVAVSMGYIWRGLLAGTPVYASAPGVVVHIGGYRGLKYAYIYGGDNRGIGYANLRTEWVDEAGISHQLVKGDHVAAGQQIGVIAPQSDGKLELYLYANKSPYAIAPSPFMTTSNTKPFDSPVDSIAAALAAEGRLLQELLDIWDILPLDDLFVGCPGG